MGVFITKDVYLSRVFAKTMRAENGCLIWTGLLDKDGYGRYGDPKKAAHRIFYEEFVGPIPQGMEVDHLCHTRDTSCMGGSDCPHRACVEPSHLEPVSRTENNRRQTKTACRAGHVRTPTTSYQSTDGYIRCRPCACRRSAEYLARKRARLAAST